MKPRRVIVVLELESSVPLRKLGSARWWEWRGLSETGVIQAHANVAKFPKPKKPRTKKK
jgi:hypothetical protein